MPWVAVIPQHSGTLGRPGTTSIVCNKILSSQGQLCNKILSSRGQPPSSLKPVDKSDLVRVWATQKRTRGQKRGERTAGFPASRPGPAGCGGHGTCGLVGLRLGPWPVGGCRSHTRQGWNFMPGLGSSEWLLLPWALPGKYYPFSRAAYLKPREFSLPSGPEAGCYQPSCFQIFSVLYLQHVGLNQAQNVSLSYHPSPNYLGNTDLGP